MEDKFHELKCEIALLKQAGGLIKVLLPLLSIVATGAFGFAWGASSKIAILETENAKLKEEIQEHQVKLDAIGPEFANTANWTEENFVSKELFEQHQRDHK